MKSAITYWIFCCATLLLFCPRAGATHIIGGVLTYTDLGGNDYAITLKLYRDCGPSNTNGTVFDPTAAIGFFDSNGFLQTTINLTNLITGPVPFINNNPCLVPPPVCVEEGIYSGTVNLPILAGGYTLAYQRCCRNPTILNLDLPQTQGITAVAQIPGPAMALSNASPEFIDFPPIAICVNDTLIFDHSAFDADGDSLVYGLCNPLQGGSQGNAAPVPPLPPPYSSVLWATGFSGGNPLPGAPGLAIDSQSGSLTAAPNQIGQYVVGVCVQEYRNGILLSETRRDFQFNVVTCAVATTSSVQQQQNLCDGLTVSFTNQSIGATDYFWDFGVLASNADTSIVANPTFTFPDTGTYVITLVANPSWPCSDTSWVTYDIRLPLDPQLTVPGVMCFDEQPVPLEVSGEFDNQALISWDLGPLALNPVMSGTSVSAAYQQAGFHPFTVDVSQYGCSETVSDSVTIFPNPTADFEWDDMGCLPFGSQFVNTSVAWTTMEFDWNFGDGDSSSIRDPFHVYDTPGVYDVSLTVSTDSGCVDTVVKFVPEAILVQPRPTAGFHVDRTQVNILDGQINVFDSSQHAINWTYFAEGQVYTTPDFTHLFNGGGTFNIMQIVTNDVGCKDTALVPVLVHDHLFYAPNAFTPNGDGMNDTWLPSALGAVIYDLTIFDRWGNEVFRTNDRHEAWTAEEQMPGIYSYRVRLRAGGGYMNEYTGHITLLR